MIRRIAIVSSLLVLTACSTYSLEELRQTTPQGDAFQTELAKLYMNFAAQEEKEYDWRDSWYFADKGLIAIYGKDTTPEDLASWNLPEEALPQLERARADLARLLTPETIARKPLDAAKAQFYFDCWVEQQEENWQVDDIEYCKGEYLRSISRLEGATKPVKKKTSDKKMPVKAVKTAETKKLEVKPEVKKLEVNNEQPEPVELKKQASVEDVKTMAATTSSFVVFFESGAAMITDEGAASLSDIVKSLSGKKDYAVILTNKSKNADANIIKERVSVITKRLVDGGVNSVSISEQASSAQVTHKVEIFIND